MVVAAEEYCRARW